MFIKNKAESDVKSTTPSKVKDAAKNAVPSVVSEDMNILGNIICDGYIDINGRIDGNVKCLALTVREKGYVKGDIIAGTVDVYGEVSGLIKATHVNLHSKCRIEGVVMHKTLTVEEGAFIDGQCKRTDKLPEQAQAKLEERTNLLENIRVIQGSNANVSSSEGTA